MNLTYANYDGFGESYFEGNSVTTPHEAGYSNYRRGVLPFDFYAKKINDELVSQGIDPAGEKILIAGCAYGYTVEYLIDNHGVDAYGIDVSSFAVSQADTEIAYGGRIFQGDVLSSQDLRSVRQNSGGGRFRVVFNECILTCLTDSEAQTASDNMRSESQDLLVHRVWSTDGSDLEKDLDTDWYNSHTLSEWQSLCDPNGDDLWFTEREFQP